MAYFHVTQPRSTKPSEKGSMSACWLVLSRSLLIVALALMSSTLQGCFLGTPFSHPTPAWMDYPPYWLFFQYVVPRTEADKNAKNPMTVVHNSCELNLTASEQCSGHGECKPWRPDLRVIDSQPTQFCQCYRDWADPECRTKRKSQMVAYFLSIFGGYLGLDHFYLGLYYSGFAKLATLGLAGIWYVYDVVRIGSAPVYAHDFRVAYDLPHWFYVMFTVAFFSILSYIIFGFVTVEIQRENKNRELLMKAEDAYEKTKAAAFHINPEDRVGYPTFASYPLPLPGNQDMDLYYGACPPAVRLSGTLNGEINPFSPYAVWKHATSNGYFAAPPHLDGRLRPYQLGTKGYGV